MFEDVIEVHVGRAKQCNVNWVKKRKKGSINAGILFSLDSWRPQFLRRDYYCYVTKQYYDFMTWRPFQMANDDASERAENNERKNNGIESTLSLRQLFGFYRFYFLSFIAFHFVGEIGFIAFKLWMEWWAHQLTHQPKLWQNTKQ